MHHEDIFLILRGIFLLCPSKQSLFVQFTQMEFKYTSIPLSCTSFYSFQMSIISVLQGEKSQISVILIAETMVFSSPLGGY